MPGWMQATLWALLGGLALVVGAVLGWFVRVPGRVIAAVMAFGAGVLISALAFDLTQEAANTGGVLPTTLGFLAGALAYVGANAALARRGARHRKRSGHQQAADVDKPGSGTAIAIGALLDGIPESVVLGLSVLVGGAVSAPFIAAVAISNLPEGLSSAAGMRNAGRSVRYTLGVWSGIAVASALSAGVGYVTLAAAGPAVIAVITAIAAGAILTMVADTMIPEAFEQTHMLTGLITALGFLVAFAISRAGG